MKKETLKLLTKEQLIEIITSDKMWEHKAFYKILDLVQKKIESIIDAQEKCGCFSEEYLKLEKEYKKWSKIQDNL